MIKKIQQYLYNQYGMRLSQNIVMAMVFFVILSVVLVGVLSSRTTAEKMTPVDLQKMDQELGL